MGGRPQLADRPCASHERELTRAKAIFEDVLPARYDVVVSGPDGEEHGAGEKEIARRNGADELKLPPLERPVLYLRV